MNVVYLAHKISGNEKNVDHLLQLIKNINLNYPDIVPLANVSRMSWLLMIPSPNTANMGLRTILNCLIGK